MEETHTGKHEKLLTEVIQKQIALLGPAIALSRARNVPGITVSDDGVVIQLQGDHQQLTQQLVEQFMELSGLIVRKTLEPLVASHPGIMQSIAKPAAPIDQVVSQLTATPLEQTIQVASTQSNAVN